MSFKDLNLKSVYRSDNSNIAKDFYFPALAQSIRYDRAVGYFSASMISFAAQGISSLIRNNGIMRLVVSAELNVDEAEAFHDGYKLRQISENLFANFFNTLDSIESFLFQERLKALSYLVAQNRLDVKVAFKKKGMYHEKIGIMYDENNDFIVFQGSANETESALNPDLNFESINIFPSWIQHFEPYWAPYLTGFDKLWTNKTNNVVVIDIPDTSLDHFRKIAPQYRAAFYFEEINLVSDDKDFVETKLCLPTVPLEIRGNKFELFNHQRDALNEWRSRGGQSLLKLATGSGKTITGLYCATTIYQHIGRLFLIIAVPYQNLAEQWAEECRLFSFSPLKCYQSKNLWLKEAKTLVNEYVAGQRSFVSFVVVNNTLCSDEFQDLISIINYNELFFIGDECHHHSSPKMIRLLPNNAAYRLGLSATPESDFDPTKISNLISYYGNIAFEYTLSNALNDNVLTRYFYYIHWIDFTEKELNEYIDLSEKISSLYMIDKESEALKALLLKRSRLIGSASNKIGVLDSLLKKTNVTPHTLFYCGDGSVEINNEESMRQINLVSGILHDNGWKSSQFTSSESKSDREIILNYFKTKKIDALVAIRCLDEGIDIPACDTAYILASSTNSRQQIQRRGRILRRSPGKQYSVIHDFIVKIPHSIATQEVEKKLFSRELSRVHEFAKLANNADEISYTLSTVLSEYGLEYLAYA